MHPLKHTITLVLGFLFACQAHATVTLNIGAGTLRSQAGLTLAPTNSLVVLVADTEGDGVTMPSPEDFATGDDVILFRGILGGTEPGIFTKDLVLSLTPPIQVGDPIEMFWFPTLTLGDTSPGLGTPYGFYSDFSGLDGSSPWVFPADGGNVGLSFLTIEQGGLNPEFAGWANFVVHVPEPSTYLLGISAAILAWVTRRHLRR